MALALVSLLAAMWAGLGRVGFRLPPIQGNLPMAHGPLMVCGFLGTLISLERAVALGCRSAYVAPLGAGLGALALIVGFPGPAAPLLISLGSLGLVWSFALILNRQTTLFTITMAWGALAWVVGNCLWLTGTSIPQVVPWWAGFLVLTIVGERLELSRFSAYSRLRREIFTASAALYIAGLIVASIDSVAGFRLQGAGMLALALWLLVYDVARQRFLPCPRVLPKALALRLLGYDVPRRPVQRGLVRFIAISLISGSVWLGASGVMWFTFAGTFTLFDYDAMLHSVFLGFVFSMIFAHAPIIFPAVLGRPLPFRRIFYAHVGLLHLSLILRVGGGDLARWFWAYQWGGMLNVLAILLFLGTTVYTLIEGRRAPEPRPAEGHLRAAEAANVSGVTP